MSDQDPLTGRPVTPPEVPVPPTGTTPTVPTTGVPPAGAPTTASVPPSGGQTTSGGGDSASDQARAKAEQAKEVAAEKAGEAKEKAAVAGEVAREHAGNVSESAKAHVGEVADEAVRQVSNLAEQGVSQLRQQADSQAEKAAELLQGFSDQLNAMARGEKAPEGPLLDLVQEGAQRIEGLASRLRTGGLDMAMQDVRRFARRRPGTFLAVAFGAGMAAGRLARNTDTSHLTGSNGNGYSGNGGGYQGVSTGAQIQPSYSAVPAPMETGTTTAAMPGAPTMAGSDPMVSGDPTGLQGGRR